MPIPLSPPISSRSAAARRCSRRAAAAVGQRRAHARRDNREFTELAPGIVSMRPLRVEPQPQRFAFAVLAKEGYASGQPARVGVAPAGQTPSRPSSTPRRTSEGSARVPRRVHVMAELDSTGASGTACSTTRRDRRRSCSRSRRKPRADRAGAASARAPRRRRPATRWASTRSAPAIRCARCTPCRSTSIIGKGRPDRGDVRDTGALPDPVLRAGARQRCCRWSTTYSDRIDFVHVEIYENNQTTDVVPTVSAWRLGGEPWLFGDRQRRS